MKFNVHKWNGKDWEFVASVRGDNEKLAVESLALAWGLKGKFAAYPHIDDYNGQVTAKSPFVTIQ